MPTRRVSWVVLLPGLLLCAAAFALTRPIPADAKRGFIKHAEQMIVTMDGKPMRLAPGAIIRARNNLIIVPTALPPAGANAAYVLDAQGQIFRVWLLTPEELARPSAPAR